MLLDIREACKAMRRRENRRWFRNLWEYDRSNRYDFFELAKYIAPEITLREFEHYWQYAIVLHPQYSVAIQEFTLILFGGL